MKQYELTVLIHPDLEMNLQPALDKIAKVIESAGGKITKEVNEGKKHMSYKIKGQDFAVYYSYDVDLPMDAPEKIDRALTITEEVIRHLLVIRDARRDKMAAKRKAVEADEADEEENKEEEDN